LGNDHSDVSVLASSICGGNAGCGSGQFLGEQTINVFVAWLSIIFCEFKIVETVLCVMFDSLACKVLIGAEMKCFVTD
jgi:hypothetical protein